MTSRGVVSEGDTESVVVNLSFFGMKKEVRKCFVIDRVEKWGDDCSCSRVGEFAIPQRSSYSSDGGMELS